MARLEHACAGRWLGSPPEDMSRPLVGVSTDTRHLARGEVFFALQGPRFDGHAFVQAARASGAAAAVVHRAPADAGGLPLLLVEDTTSALGALARDVRASVTIPVVGITGSVGKTSTKEFTALLLEGRGPVLRTQGNLNNHIGVPLTLLRLRPEHAAAVVEMGMSAPGEIRLLTTIARPDVAVITNVAPVHLEFFSSLDEIAAAKAEILEGLGANGIAALNYDDERVRGIGRRWDGRRVWFGVGDDGACDVAASGMRGDWSSTAFDLRLGNERHAVRVPLPGDHVVSNVLAAAAVAHALGVPGAEVARRVAHLEAAAGRGARVALRGHVTILDDSYNANPVAVEAAVRVLGSVTGRRRVAFLGDMLELGPSSPDLHRTTGTRVASHVDLLVGVGPMAEHLVAGARAAGLAAAQVLHCADAVAAASEAVRVVQAGDVVLVKGSRGMRTERVVEALRERFGVED